MIGDKVWERALNCACEQFESYWRSNTLQTPEQRKIAINDVLQHAVGLLQMENKTREVHDPFLNKTIQVRDNLVDRAMTPDGYFVSGSRGFSWACKNLKGCPTVTICAGTNRCMTKQQSNLRWLDHSLQENVGGEWVTVPTIQASKEIDARRFIDWIESYVKRDATDYPGVTLNEFFKQAREKIAELRAKDRGDG